MNTQSGSNIPDELKAGSSGSGKVKWTAELFSPYEIQRMVEQLARNLDWRYKDVQSPILVVGLLSGAAVFVSDLIRRMAHPTYLGWMNIQSYHGTKRQGLEEVVDPPLFLDVGVDISSLPVLLVDGIVDSGMTMLRAKAVIESKKPRSIGRVCLLKRASCPHDVEHVGASVQDDAFVVGYGMDYHGLFRGASSIWGIAVEE